MSFTQIFQTSKHQQCLWCHIGCSYRCDILVNSYSLLNVFDVYWNYGMMEAVNNNRINTLHGPTCAFLFWTLTNILIISPKCFGVHQHSLQGPCLTVDPITSNDCKHLFIICYKFTVFHINIYTVFTYNSCFSLMCVAIK